MKPCDTCAERLGDVEGAWRERRGICPSEHVESEGEVEVEEAESSGSEEDEEAVSIVTEHYRSTACKEKTLYPSTAGNAIATQKSTSRQEFTNFDFNTDVGSRVFSLPSME